MGTSGNGTVPAQLTTGLTNYMQTMAPNSSVVTTQTVPTFGGNQYPTWQSIYDGLLTGSAVQITMWGGDNHSVTVTGFNWNDASQNGIITASDSATITVVDPWTGLNETLPIWQNTVGGVIQIAISSSYTGGATVNSQILSSTVTTPNQWNSAGSANWSSTSSWLGPVPNGAGTMANFLNAATGPTTVTLDSSRTVGYLNFDSPNAYSLVAAGSSTLTLLQSGSGSATISVTSVFGAGAHTIASPLVLASPLLITQNSSTPLTISAPISDGGNGFALTTAGVGTVILANANTYAGGTTISAGTLQLGTGASGQDGSLSSNINNNSALVYNLAGNQTFSGAIRGTGTVSKTGNGSLTLAGANTYSGATSIVMGTLALGSNSGLSSASTVTLGSASTGGSLDLAGYSPTVSGLVVAPGAVAANQIIGNSSKSSPSTLTVNPGLTGSSTFGGVIQDAIASGNQNVSLYLTGGTLALTGQNTYTGPTNIGGNSVLVLGPGGVLGNTSVNVAGGGTFATGYTAPGTIDGGGNLSLAGGSTLNMQDGSINTLAFTGNGTFGQNSSSSTLLEFDLGLGQADQVAFGGDASANGTLNFAFSAPSGIVSPGVYPLVTAAAGGLGGGGYSLNNTTGSIAGQSLTLSSNASGIYVTVGDPAPARALLSQGAAIPNTQVVVNPGGIFATGYTANGTINGGSNLTMYSGATLDMQDGAFNTLAFSGSAYIGAPIQNANGSAASTLIQLDLGPGQNDELSFAGAAALSGTVNFAFATSSVTLSPGKYTLLTAAGGLLSASSGTGSGFALNNVTGKLDGQSLYLSHDADNIYVSIGTPLIGAIVAAPTASAIITGGSTPFTFTVSNSGSYDLNFSAVPGASTTGSVSGPIHVGAGNTSLATSGMTFAGTSIGPSQSGAFTVSDPNAANGPQVGQVAVNVYDHASGSISGTTIVLPNTIVGYHGQLSYPTSISVNNANGYRANLKTTSSIQEGNVSFVNVSGVAPGTNAFLGVVVTLSGSQWVGQFSLNQTATIGFADDSTLSGALSNVGTAAVAIAGVVFDHASGTASGTTIALPDSIAGYVGSLSGASSATVTNVSGYRADLVTTGGTSSGYVSINNVSGIHQGNSSTIGAAANLDGTQGVGPGSLNQTFNLTYADDPTLLGASSNLGSLSVTVTGNVYNHSSGSASGTTIALPDSIAGYSGTLAGASSATVSNAAGYRVNLQTTGGTSAGFVSINNVNGIAPGSSAAIAADAAVNGTQPAGPGALNQTFNLTYADNSNLPGVSSNLGALAIAVSGNVYNHASGSAVGTTIALPDSIVGYTGSLAGATSATVSNADGYRVNLQTTGGTSSGFVSINNVSGVAAGSSSSIAAAANLSGAQLVGPGTLDQTFNLSYSDDSNLAGASGNLGSLSIAVTGNVYDHASPSTAGTIISLPDSIAGYTGSLAGATSATVSNATGYRVNLQTFGGTSSGFVSINNVSGVAAGSSSSIAAAANLSGAQLVGPGTLDQTFNLSYADDSNLAGASGNLGSLSIAVTGNVYDHASGSLDGTTITLPVVHVGYSGNLASQNGVTISNAAGYRVNLKTTGGSASAGGISLSGDLSGLAEGGAGGTISATLSAGQSAGVINQAFSLALGDDSALPGANASVASTTLTVTGGVFSGNGIWNSASGSLWGSGNNWTDENGVQAAPGTFAGFGTTDTATFNGAGSVATISLSGANPSLKAITFSTSNYLLTDGTLTLATGDGSTPSITVTDGSTQEIDSTIAGTQGVFTSGPGTLILGGSNTFTGSLDVNEGTVVLNGANALAAGSSLLIGSTSSLTSLLSAQSIPASPPSPVNLAPVPEPGSLSLLAAAVIAVLGFWRGNFFGRLRKFPV
jgi:autotransporter-associated beta strand protein